MAAGTSASLCCLVFVGIFVFVSAGEAQLLENSVLLQDKDIINIIGLVYINFPLKYFLCNSVCPSL